MGRVGAGLEVGNLDCTRKCHIVTVWSIRLPPSLDALLLARKCNSIPHWWVAVRNRWIDRSIERCVTCSWLQDEGGGGGAGIRTLPMVAKYAISPGCHRWPNAANWQYLWTRTRFCRRFNWIVVASPVDPSHSIRFVARRPQLANYFHQNCWQFLQQHQQLLLVSKWRS